MNLNPLVLMRKEFDGTGIVFAPADGKTMKLNTTGVTIWQCLERGCSQEEIVEDLVERYSTDTQHATADVSAFLVLLKEKGLLAD